MIHAQPYAIKCPHCGEESDPESGMDKEGTEYEDGCLACGENFLYDVTVVKIFRSRKKDEGIGLYGEEGAAGPALPVETHDGKGINE